MSYFTPHKEINSKPKGRNMSNNHYQQKNHFFSKTSKITRVAPLEKITTHIC